MKGERAVKDLDELSPLELLRLHARVAAALRDRGVTRTANNPTGDYGELLFCRAFGWQQAKNSQQGVDAVDERGIKYQIKAIRMTPGNRARQLSILRDLGDGHFDFLAAALFRMDYGVSRAVLIPHRLVLENARPDGHQRGHRFYLRDAVWEWDGVEDVTGKLLAAEQG